MGLNVEVQLVLLAGMTVAQGLALTAAFSMLGQIYLKRENGIKALVTDDGPRIGWPVPEIEATDAHGRPFRSADRLDRAWVLIVGSPGCAACEHFFKSVRAAQRGLPEPIEFVFLMDATPEEARRCMARFGMTGVVALDLGGEIQEAMGVNRTPHGFLVAPGGRIRMKGIVNNRLMLESLIEGRGYVGSHVVWQ